MQSSCHFINLRINQFGVCLLFLTFKRCYIIYQKQQKLWNIISGGSGQGQWRCLDKTKCDSIKNIINLIFCAIQSAMEIILCENK